MKENKKFKSFRSELTESEYSEVIMGQPNTSAHTDFGTHRIDYPKVMANINAMLSVISKTSSVDPMEAFNKIRCRLNIVMLDFDFNIFRNWDQGVGSFVVPVTRFGRVDGYDAMTGQVRFDGKANNPDGFKELSMVVTVDLDADSLYVVSAKLYASDELQTTDAVDSVKEETTPSRGATRKQLDAEKTMDYRAAQKFYEKDMPNQILRARLEDRKRTAAKNSVKEEVEQIDEVKKKRMLNLTGLPTDKGTIPFDDTKQRPGGAGAKRTKKHPGTGLPKSGLLRGQRWSGLLGAQMNDPKKVKPEDRYLRKEDVEQVDEAGQAKLYRMRYSHGRARRRGDKKKQDAMGIATYDKQTKEDAKDLKRTGSAFGMRVKRLAGNRKAMGYSESTLIGKQKKLDVNKNKRLDAEDFKALRAKRMQEKTGYSESALIGKQKKLDVNKNKRLDAEDFKALRAKRTMPDR
jgi:hypothetical protein